MQNELMEKYIRISRVIITLMVFIVLNAWFLYENDPQWVLSIIISGVVFLINFPSSKICKFIINKGDKIKSKILKAFYYFLALPIIFIIPIFIVGLGGTLIVFLFDELTGFLNLGWAVLIAFTGIGIFTYIFPYFQTLIILVLRHFMRNSSEN